MSHPDQDTQTAASPTMGVDDLLQDVDPYPFTRIVWHSVEKQLEWGPVLQRAATVHDKAEYEMVKQGERACATVHITPKDYDQWMERIVTDRLVWLPITRTKSYQGFSHKHFPTHPGDPHSSVYGVLARTKNEAEEFRAASTARRTDHKAIGRLLGYPECCTSTFDDVWPSFFDPIYQAAQSSHHEVVDLETHKAIKVTPHVATNQMVRYAGFRLTSHFPCRLDCEATIEGGKKWLKVSRSVDPQGTEFLMRILSLPGEWSVLHGVAQVVTPHFTLITNSMPTKTKWAVTWDEILGYEG